jgi:3-dehydroquinate dehydratase-2
MKTILLIHGPNLNLLGKRNVKHYGSLTLEKLVALVKSRAKKMGLSIKPFQSNHEGGLIDFLQKHAAKSGGIIINAGAFTHYSYALYDALLDANLPAVEVHISNINNREAFRKLSVIAPACKKVISGKKERGYFEALDYFKNSR